MNRHCFLFLLIAVALLSELVEKELTLHLTLQHKRSLFPQMLFSFVLVHQLQCLGTQSALDAALELVDFFLKKQISFFSVESAAEFTIYNFLV